MKWGKSDESHRKALSKHEFSMKLKELINNEESLFKFINKMEPNLLITPSYLKVSINKEIKKQKRRRDAKDKLYRYLNRKELQFINYFVRVSAAVVGSLFLVYWISNDTALVKMNQNCLPGEYTKELRLMYEEEYKAKTGIVTLLDKINKEIIIFTDNLGKSSDISE